MKVDEFLEPEKTEAPEEIVYTSLSPTGIEIAYSPSPRRYYKVRRTASEASTDWLEVPSVTTALDVLDKPALKWWAFRVGLQAVQALWESGDFPTPTDDYELLDLAGELERVIVERQLSPNHVTSKAQDRGVNVHSALEGWAVDQTFRADPDFYQPHERGYINGLNQFLEDIGQVEEVQAELMVGSLVHGFAGRFDLRLIIPNEIELVTRVYPKRAAKRETIPAGTYILDLKTSSGCFSSHSIQLAAYEIASQECGYGSSDFRAIIRVSDDGRYEFRRSTADEYDFIAVLGAYKRMQRKAWFV